MPRSLQLESPAKLNLMLHITGQREDGYHDLQTAFQIIDLHDTLTFSKTESKIQRISGNEQVAEKDDLIIKAAKLLQQHCSTTQGVNISIKKNIPMGGGLGGGSSNAATTLMALNYLWDLQLDSIELQKIGLQLGADIPIFIFGQNAWAEGVGDELKAINLPKSWFLVIHPQVFVSTEQIFSSKHLTRDCHPITIRAFLEGSGRNVCQPVACELYPEIQKALNWLNQFSPARMTGTGACIFAIFDSAEKANIVKSQIPEKWTGFVAEGLDSNPVTDICFEADK
ncbi:MAG: 4-(cytidine 5'-diphospho)-2-C-methyl-D-erythritol kinase [Gammaproteobacteria bacterium]|jgi:4-diphosphocytidyl-2-C-methyl-D-erythritol kinase|nr:4-(cytidine 5'-diphospho)-2-C-methyl-D-erythritol kinase [Gammaproteobacteria bacterium]MBT3723716.1 4-(cytidine 5'-diphospho)-2-C-methyl-D-erythritol kinase [Gammaproteobacteria bacterium]MBT4195082.1 4-(cytidine 5'-diphospho)-2-C-methyl-D-erythritol kinase [Gammaproteobacteria bacterium]MBT4450964.1 4-(cytidine 5'-diphospho)-2-C-methyl-D-erythritol kinase [Gammaproteobacteria bacterium]MBT4860132.1 4-(cytidine 5'-diphospho)-2-C-methyl-D-erythritol kinase [Gammaproteobacteria bacterium]